MSDKLRTLVFDTETTGVRPRKPKGAPKDWKPSLSHEPALVQLAAMLFEGTRPVSHLSCFLHPKGGDKNPVPIPDPAFSKSGDFAADKEFFDGAGITQDVVDAVGLDYRVGLGVLNNMVRVSDRIVAHNMQFDDPIIRAAYSRISASQRQWWDTPKFCTIHSLTDVMKLPGKWGFKWPSLDEAYRYYVDPDGFDGAHDAMVDVVACSKILFAVEELGIPLWQLPEDWPEE